MKTDRLTAFTRESDLSKHRGVGYLDFLERLLEATGARGYLEIGTATGASLARVRCPAICVDPSFGFRADPTPARPATLLFRMASDRFFERWDPRSLLPGGIDVAFVDGMHLFENVLRDVINIETVLHARAVLLIHDCLPLESKMAERCPPRVSAGESAWWTGDVWKLAFALKSHRPGLRAVFLDCVPTGMLMLTGLSPADGSLSAAYDEILDSYLGWELDEERRAELFRLYPTISTRDLGVDGIRELLGVSSGPSKPRSGGPTARA